MDDFVPKALKRVYHEADRTHNLVVDYNFFVDNTEFTIKECDLGLGIFKNGTNQTPDILMSVGATYLTSGIRGDISVYKKSASVTSKMVQEVAKTLREKFKASNIQVNTIPDHPSLQLKKINGLHYKQPSDPIFPGVSISASGLVGDGTLGFFARLLPSDTKATKPSPSGQKSSKSARNQNGVVLVTAGHVLLSEQPWDSTTVYHPGQAAAKEQDEFARIIASGVSGTAPTPGRTVPVDAAMAHLDKGVEILANKVEEGEIVDWLGVLDIKEEDLFTTNVFKVGAGTGLRTGVITGRRKVESFRILNDKGVFVGYGSIQNVLTVQSSRDESFSRKLDSGAPVLLQRDKGKFTLCGIVVGGQSASNNQRSVSYFCPIWTIAKHLNITQLSEGLLETGQQV